MTKNKKILSYIILSLGVIALIVIFITIIDGIDEYKRDIHKYNSTIRKAIAGNWNWLPSYPEFIHGNNETLQLNLSTAVSFFGLLSLIFIKSFRRFKYFKFSLVIYILVCVLCMSALVAHLFIGTNERTYYPTSNSHTRQDLSITEECTNTRSDEIEIQQKETNIPRCPLVDNFGIGIVHWYFNANKNCYIAFVFTSENAARLVLQDGTVIENPYSRYLTDRDTHLFSGKNGTKSVFSLREDGKYLTYRGKPSDKYAEHAQYVGIAQSNGSSEYYLNNGVYPTNEQESTISTTQAQRVCSFCNGKGWRAGNKTAVYDMGEIYCSECGGYYPNSHSHDPCPSCQGKGYLNY